MIATLALPPMFFYARSVADGLISLVAVLFLANRWGLRDYAWLRAPHVRLLLVFWVWIMLCSLVAGTPHAVGESIAVVRLFIFAAALEFWLLVEERPRRYVYAVVAVMAAWLILEIWQQYVFGVDLVGNHPWGTGVLTGPFQRARAGATLQTMYFVAFLPPAIGLMDQQKFWRRAAGGLLLIGTLLSVAVVGQRMPMILTVFGLCLTGLIARPTRRPIAAALLVLVLAVAAARIVSPITYHTLVVVFVRRMSHFWSTVYAQLYQRAAVMVQMHPWLGLGFDGFRDNCNDPRYFRELSWLPVTRIGHRAGCNVHPHNYWLEVATDGGLPAVALFALLCGVWLVRMARGVFGPNPRAMQIALLVTLCVEAWPVQSTTALFTIPNAGWIFLFLGWGLAEARYGLAAATRQPSA